MSYKLGSLFDGSGGFPLAGSLCGIDPRWASEVEPYPIAVTRERFPNMKHLGDISKINGAEVEPVDIITFGSPCQDLSVAGKRAGLKHEANGDEETTRSGLFMEAVRIIKEMRAATNGQYPRFALWENVPGAFSSNKGEDFRVVCEELIKIVEPSAFMPEVPKNGWAYADSYIGDGWSLAYRVFDAQYWGVPQRRRRIHLVADFRGECARQVLFERDGVRGYFTQSGTQRQTAAADIEGSAGATDREGEGFDGYNGDLTGDKSSTLGVNCEMSTGRNGVIEKHEAIPYTLKIRSGCEGGGKGALIQKDKSATLATNNDQTLFQPVYSIENHPADSRVNIDESGKVQCLTSRMGTGGGNVPMVLESVTGGNFIDVAQPIIYTRGYGGNVTLDGVTPTLEARAGTGGNNQPIVAYIDTSHADDVVRVDNIVAPVNKQEQDKAVFYSQQEGQTECYRQGGFGDYVEGEVGTAPGHHNGVVIHRKEPILHASKASFFTKVSEGAADCLVATDYKDPQLVAYPSANRYIVRRLTPTECARLQGFADRWGHIEQKTELTDEEFRFWQEVRNTHAAINGKPVKEYTVKQMLTWYNKLHIDSAEYKMWGNGIALPPALYCMQGIADALAEATGEKHELSADLVDDLNRQNSEAVSTVMDFITEEPVAESEGEAEGEATDLSEAPGEIKQEILENDEKLKERSAEKMGNYEPIKNPLIIPTDEAPTEAPKSESRELRMKEEYIKILQDKVAKLEKERDTYRLLYNTLLKSITEGVGA